MQEDILQKHITISEAMFFSASLKIGSHMTATEKKTRVSKIWIDKMDSSGSQSNVFHVSWTQIKEIIKAIGLYECRKTMTGDLSGGQKKRLAIAIELVDNPPVMFFDEPTK